MTSKQIIRWGIIGAGNVCEIKSGPAFYKAPGSQLLAVMRRDGEKARAFAQRHHVPHAYDNAEALLANTELDAIYIATPPAFHKNYTLAALAAGKHVYIEKPVTLNACECDEIIAASKNSPVKISVAHYRRQLPCFLKFAELLQQGAIGQPILASIDMLQSKTSNIIANTEENWRVNPALSGGGLFHDLSPHQLDLMLQWFGEVKNAEGIAINQLNFTQADDCVHGWARFSSGVVLQGRWHYGVNKNHTKDSCEVIGTEGKLSINFFGQQVIRLQNAKGEQEFHIPNPPHIQQPFIEQVNAYFRGERSNPCSINEAKLVMELIDKLSEHY